MWNAEVKYILPGSLTLNEVDELIEKVRETAFPTLKERTLTVVWEEDNEWDLRGLVQSTLDEMEEFSCDVDIESIRRYETKSK